MKLARPIAFLDVESTGVDPVKDRIIEIGVVVLSETGKGAEWVQRFNPGMPIPADSTEIHGITDADVADKPPFSDFAHKIARGFIGKDLAGYNLRRLDLPIIDEELRRCRLKLDLTGVHVIDSFGIFSKKEPRKLEDAVRRYCKREHEGAHGAASDASATLDVFLAQVEEYEDLRGMAIDKIAEFSRMGEQVYADIAGKLYFDKDGDVCYAFGKYKDAKVKDQPGYADWMISKDFPGSTCEVLKSVLSQMEVTH